MPLPTKRQLHERSRATESEYKADLKLRVAGMRGDVSYEDAIDIVNLAVRFAAQIGATDDILAQAKAA